MGKARSVFFRFRVSLEERRLLESIAEREARCASEALREVLREAGMKHGSRPNTLNKALDVKKRNPP